VLQLANFAAHRLEIRLGGAVPALFFAQQLLRLVEVGLQRIVLDQTVHAVDLALLQEDVAGQLAVFLVEHRELHVVVAAFNLQSVILH